MSEAPASPEDFRMSVGEHIEELRRRLVLMLVGVGVALALSLYFGKPLITWLVLPLAYAQRAAGLPPQTYTFGPATGFTIYLKVSIVAAIVLAAPWILYQAWRFVAAGLYRHEKRVVLLLAPFSALMVALGVLFMYYIMIPICLWFFIGFAASYPSLGEPRPSFMFRLIERATGVTPAPPTITHHDAPAATLPMLQLDPPHAVEGQTWIKVPENELRVRLGGETRSVPLTRGTLMNPLIEVGQYLSFVATLGVGIVVTFQTPVVMTVGAWAGLITAAQLRALRRYCVFICFFIGMIVSPPDGVSMLVLALPLWALYEAGLILMHVAERSRRVT